MASHPAQRPSVPRGEEQPASNMRSSLRRPSERSVDDLIHDTMEARDADDAIVGFLSARFVALFAAACLASAAWVWVTLASSPSVEAGEEATTQMRTIGFHGMKNLSLHAVGTALGLKNASSSLGAATSLDENDSHATISTHQIQNYKDGKALIVNVHITHHAGTTFCGLMKQWGAVPSFACMGGDNFNSVTTPDERKNPWTHDDTGHIANKLRQHFHMVSWEYGRIPSPPLASTEWENPGIVSVYVTRDPIDRLLSGGGKTNTIYGTLSERTEADWWRYANSTYTDNFALNRLTKSGCVDGERTTEACLDEAKQLLDRFTFVLDLACLSEGLAALGEKLGRPQAESKGAKKKPKSSFASAKERINNDKVYEYLLRQNRRDIEFYNWSKSRSIIDCSSLDPDDAGGEALDADGLVAVRTANVSSVGPPPTNAESDDHANIAAQQVQNYKEKNAVIVNVHITHHAGTSVCGLMKQWGAVPEFACNGGQNFNSVTTPKEREKPWTHNATGPMAEKMRQYFHMVSWEFGRIPSPPLASTEWENPRVVSIYVTRDPIDRLLSGGGTINRKFGGIHDRSEADWWRYANSTYTDNFALNRLTKSSCVDGERTAEACLDEAKELLDRFTFVLDIACLGDGFAALGEKLGRPPTVTKGAKKKPKSSFASAKDRINNDKVYEYLLRRNRRDIEFYDWSKSKSLVNCSSLYPDDDGDEVPDVDGAVAVGTTNISIIGPPATNEVSDTHFSIAAHQIQNYKDGKALIVNVHITHHAGTSFCGLMRQWGPVPSFACMGGDNFNSVTTPEDRKRPWTHNNTGHIAEKMRQHFHMVSWEYGRIPSPPLASTEWENPGVVSVYISRDPMDRLLAGDGKMNGLFGNVEKRTEEQWWGYTKHENTNNFALNRLTNSRCVNGEETTEACLQEAKDLLSRFTFVLDLACLGEGFDALGEKLGRPPTNTKGQRKKPKSFHASAKERIKNEEVYEALLRRNRRDVELYEWTKGISLVNCSDIIENE